MVHIVIVLAGSPSPDITECAINILILSLTHVPCIHILQVSRLKAVEKILVVGTSFKWMAGWVQTAPLIKNNWVKPIHIEKSCHVWALLVGRSSTLRYAMKKPLLDVV